MNTIATETKPAPAARPFEIVHRRYFADENCIKGRDVETQKRVTYTVAGKDLPFKAVTLAFTVSPEGLHVGLANCTWADNFCRKKGRTIAEHRLAKPELTNPRYRRFFPDFLAVENEALKDRYKRVLDFLESKGVL